VDQAPEWSVPARRLQAPFRTVHRKRRTAAGCHHRSLCRTCSTVSGPARRGLCKLGGGPRSGPRAGGSVFREKDGPGADSVEALHQFADGTLFVGTKMGLKRHARRARSRRTALFDLHRVARAAGIRGADCRRYRGKSLDRHRRQAGAAKLVWEHLSHLHGERRPCGTTMIPSSKMPRAGWCVAARQGTATFTSMSSDGSRFRVSASLPKGVRAPDWGARNASIAMMPKATWWIATSDGLLRYSGVTRPSGLARPPAARYTERDGLSRRSHCVGVRGFRPHLWVLYHRKARWTGAVGPRDRRSSAIRKGCRGSRIRASRCSRGRIGRAFGWGFCGSAAAMPRMARLHGAAFELLGGTENTPSGGIRALHLDAKNGSGWVPIRTGSCASTIRKRSAGLPTLHHGRWPVERPHPFADRKTHRAGSTPATAAASIAWMPPPARSTDIPARRPGSREVPRRLSRPLGRSVVVRKADSRACCLLPPPAGAPTDCHHLAARSRA